MRLKSVSAKKKKKKALLEMYPTIHSDNYKLSKTVKVRTLVVEPT